MSLLPPAGMSRPKHLKCIIRSSKVKLEHNTHIKKKLFSLISGAHPPSANKHGKTKV